MYWLFVFGGLYRSIEPIRLRIANKGLNSKNLSYAICLRILIKLWFFFYYSISALFSVYFQDSP